MAAAKKSTKKSAAKKSPAKKSTAKKSPAKKSTAKKSTAKKSTKKSTAKKSTAKKSTARKSTSRASSGSNVQLVVASRIKEAAKGQGVRVAGDFAEEFNKEVNEMLTKAIDRTKSNGRGTVRPGDL